MTPLSFKAEQTLSEMDAKFAAKLFLLGDSKQIKTPTYEEWVGINLLDRDDELQQFKREREYPK